MQSALKFDGTLIGKVRLISLTTLIGALLASACSGRSIRREEDDDPGGGGSGNRGGSSGAAPSTGGVGATGGALVSRGGAVGSAGQAGRGGSVGTGGNAGAAGGDCVDGECWIDGRCRRELAASGCPATYDSVLSTIPVDGVDCAGPTTTGFVYLAETFAEKICVYDGEGALVSFRYVNDYNAHCGDRTETVTGGEPASHFTFTDFDFYRGCQFWSSFGAASVSRVFNDLFPALLSPGDLCEPASDQCRSSIQLLVCAASLDGTSCTTCMTDEQCHAEYPYLDPGEVHCEPDGQCRLGARPIGSCGESGEEPSSVCRTGAGAFVCDSARCSRCVTDEACANWTDYELGICMEDGSCISATE